MSAPVAVDSNVWTLRYPLKTAGADLRRVVTILRLGSGKLIIHSTGPFTAEDAAAIRALGEPAWMIDTLLRHDTFTAQGKAAFPGVPYLAPAGFSEAAQSLLPAPAEWAGEVLVEEIQGAPAFGEYVVLHVPSRTLIVADLVVNFEGPSLWEKLLLKIATVGGRFAPGMTKPFRMSIRDQLAFMASIKTVLGWDFDRVIVGHGDMIATGGKEKVREALRGAGFVGV